MPESSERETGVLLPIGHDESNVRRWPWVTFALMALCMLTLVATGTTTCDGSLPEWEARVQAELAEVEDEADYEPPPTPYHVWGLIPSEIRMSSVLTHQFMHAGWLHLFGNMLLLFLLGPPIEDRWGRPVFLGLYLSGGVFAGLFFAAMASSATIPLVGASGAIAAVMGAYLVRLFHSKLRYFYFFFIRMGTFEAPAYLMLPLWFFGELWSAKLSDSVGAQGGVAYWAHVGGFLYGTAFAGLIRAFQIESRFLKHRLEQRLTLVAGNPIVQEIQGLQQEGRFEEAFERLQREMRRTPEDPDVVIATWDAASALQRPHEIAGPLTQQIERWVARDEMQSAADYWCELTLLVPDAPTDPKVLLAVARRLDEDDRALEARRALGHALRHGASDLSPGLALRFFEIARTRAPELAPDAGRRALEWDQLPDERRRDLENQLAEADARRAMSTGPEVAPRAHGWRGASQRALDIDLGPAAELELETSAERFGRTSPDLAEPEPPASPPVDGPPGVDPRESPEPPGVDPRESPEPPPRAERRESPEPRPAPPAAALGSGPRIREIKAVDAVPRALEAEGLVVRRDDKLHRIPWSRIEAIGVGAVHGVEARPVLLIDLVLDWNDPQAETLQVVRLSSHRYDPRRLAPGIDDPMQAFHALVRELLERSRATPLPDAASLSGPLSTYPDLGLYESLVLDAQ